MITPGIIREIGINKGNFIGNAYRVELNIFQMPGDNDKNNYTYIANCSAAGGMYDSYEVGDVVYVGFLNNNKSWPIILGKIYRGLENESRAFANINALNVANKATLPENTKIGNIDFSDKEYFFDNVNEVIKDKNIFVNKIQFNTSNEGAGTVFFDDEEGVLQATLSPNVTLSLGVDTVLKVYNDTAAELIDGQVVYISGSVNQTPKVKLSRSNDYAKCEKTIGVITEPIPSQGVGFIIKEGFINNIIIDPAIYTEGDVLYLSPSNDGSFTKVKPIAPNFVVQVGFVSKVSSNNVTADGQMYVSIRFAPVGATTGSEATDITTSTANFTDILSTADTDVQKALDTLDKHSHPASAISYDSTASSLSATNSQTAIDELATEKLNVSNGTATELTVINNATGDVALKVNAISGTTNNLQEWQVNGTSKVVIDKDGNVGIGVLNPTAKLDILGDIKASGDASFAGDIILGNDAANNWTVSGDSDFKISQENTPIITIYENETTGSYPVKVNIDAKTMIAELEFGGW